MVRLVTGNDAKANGAANHLFTLTNGMVALLILVKVSKRVYTTKL